MNKKGWDTTLWEQKVALKKNQKKSTKERVNKVDERPGKIMQNAAKRNEETRKIGAIH